MSNIPQIAYWKWGPEHLEGNLHVERTQEFYARSGMNLLVVLMELDERGYNHPEAMRRMAEMVDAAHASGGRMAIGVDIRYLFRRLASSYPDECYGLLEVLEGDLNPGGYTEFSVNYDCRAGGELQEGGIYRVLGVRLADEHHYEPDSVVDLTPFAFHPQHGADPRSRIVIKAGSRFGGYHVLVLTRATYRKLDIFSPHVLPEYRALMERFAPMGLDGMTVDEMGYGIPHDDRGVHRFHFGEPFLRAYEAKTGRRLEDEVLLFRLAPAGDDGARYRMVNQYFELIRERMVEIEGFLYDETKRLLGPKAFVGLHPTFWNESYLESFHDGFDWWDVKRDYVQTDEHISTPVRLGLIRKFHPVWYNMWYTRREMTMQSYFREAWAYARFGGRMHYHSYRTSTEIGLVHEICAPGDLEMVAELEVLIARLNDFQRAQPDARVAIVIGSASMCNWTFDTPGATELTGKQGRMLQGIAFANGLLEQGFLCDFIPDYEIEHGEAYLNADGHLQYGSQTYDALVVLYPECIKPRVLAFYEQVTARMDNVIVIGGCRYGFTGENVQAAFDAAVSPVAYRFAELPEPRVVADILRGWQVPGNLYANGCRYQDGSAIFAAGGDLHRGNPLVVDAIVQGHRVQARGQDLLAIRLTPDGAIEEMVHGGLTDLRIDGKPCLTAV